MLEEPIVTIKNGALKGCIKFDYKGKPYYSFQGIPYAKPPIGKLRFRAPHPSDPWTGVRDATKEGDGCYSKHLILGKPVGSEDCLFLNVYTPELPLKKKIEKPVMVWIHGGSFTLGSGDTELYGPDYLITENIVLVTINYRLGLLGYLSFNDISLDIPGNAGLKDQVLALKWVKENIAHFGGNPNNVTIFGESAGGASVHLLILSPAAKGLFHKAILQSGTAESLWAKCQSSTSAIASALCKENASDIEIYKELQEMPVGKILELQEKISNEMGLAFSPLMGPCIESKAAKTPFLSDAPLDVIRSGKYNHVPIMIGYTSREGILIELFKLVLGRELIFENIIENCIPHDLNIKRGSDAHKSVVAKVKNFYYRLEEPSASNMEQTYLLYGDVGFVYPTYKIIKHHKLTSNEPIYLYRMTIESKLNTFKQLTKTAQPGACHGDEIGYLFKSCTATSIIPNSIEEKGIKMFTKLWTQFAQTGNPNPNDKQNLITVTCKPIETDKYHYFEIGESITIGLNAEQDKMKFWDEIYAEYGSK